jgi:hypothetical protein
MLRVSAYYFSGYLMLLTVLLVVWCSSNWTSGQWVCKELWKLYTMYVCMQSTLLISLILLVSLLLWLQQTSTCTYHSYSNINSVTVFICSRAELNGQWPVRELARIQRTTATRQTRGQKENKYKYNININTNNNNNKQLCILKFLTKKSWRWRMFMSSRRWRMLISTRQKELSSFICHEWNIRV